MEQELNLLYVLGSFSNNSRGTPYRQKRENVLKMVQHYFTQAPPSPGLASCPAMHDADLETTAVPKVKTKLASSDQHDSQFAPQGR